MSSILFVDPGTRKLGWSKFVYDGSSVWLVKSGVEKIGDKKMGWVERSDEMVRFVVGLCAPRKKKRDRWQIERVVIELPRHYSGSEKSEAARNSGSILKLMFLIGALRIVLMGRGIPVELLRVEKWKGNVPKRITAKRVKRWWGYEATERELAEGSDEADAVGMGDYWFRKGPRKGAVICRR